MYKLEVKLKQHTPLIHFQHDQEGATLRASELKPKLDRFIMTNLGESRSSFDEKDNKCCESVLKEIQKKEPKRTELSSYEAGIVYAKCRGWIIEGQEAALSYKMKIDNDKNKSVKSISLPVFPKEKNEEIKFNTTNFALLLSNMGGKHSKDDLKNFSFYRDIMLIISSFDEDLLRCITENVEDFFLLNNFGNRHNKGFGSFTVISLNEISTSKELLALAKIPYLEFENEGKFKINRITNKEERRKVSHDDLEFYEQIFNVVDYYWKRLKSGINYVTWYEGKKPNKVKKIDKTRYCKSFLFRYLRSNTDYTWEKRFVKEKFYDLSQIATPVPYFARAILGLQDKFTYTQPTYSKYPYKQKDAKGDEISISQKGLDKTIERIASPIYFKPVIFENTVKVFILIKDGHVKKIYTDNLCRTFEYQMTKPKNEITEEIELPKKMIDYCDLIKKYHIDLIKNTQDKSFVPKDYNWNDIVKKVIIKNYE